MPISQKIAYNNVGVKDMFRTTTIKNAVQDNPKSLFVHVFGKIAASFALAFNF